MLDTHVKFKNHLKMVSEKMSEAVGFPCSLQNLL